MSGGHTKEGDGKKRKLLFSEGEKNGGWDEGQKGAEGRGEEGERGERRGTEEKRLPPLFPRPVIAFLPFFPETMGAGRGEES